MTQARIAPAQQRDQTLDQALENAQSEKWFARVSTSDDVLSGSVRYAGALYVGERDVDTTEILLVERRLAETGPASFALTGALVGAAAGALTILLNNFNEIGCTASCSVYRIGGGAMVGSMVGYGIGLSRSKHDWEVMLRRR